MTNTIPDSQLLDLKEKAEEYKKSGYPMVCSVDLISTLVEELLELRKRLASLYCDMEAGAYENAWQTIKAYMDSIDPVALQAGGKSNE